MYRFVPAHYVCPVEDLLNLPELNSRNIDFYIGDIDDTSVENSRKMFDFLATYGLIDNERVCPCGGQLSISRDKSAKHDLMEWRCNDCRKRGTVTKVSVRKGSFFQNMNLPIRKLFHIAAEWIENPGNSLESVAQSWGVNKNTVSELHERFRDLTHQWFERVAKDNVDFVLGGRGAIVEIDETSLFKAKHNRGRLLLKPTQWVFGMLERGTGKAYHIFT
ncbi:hypothetical protein B9Z55_027576 [Caenorhabditis nigoni]|nr:hypothetical protein B9Z55_027576 [Caenorhabditis nigoni]